MPTVVLVHGNPETSAIWGPLIEALDVADVATLSPPGFGAPVPVGFGSTTDEYLAWLVAELEAMGEPVDLVGHDWGGGHAMRVAIDRPDLLRSWVTDIGGAMAPDYVWHDMARAWQTSGEGEELVAGMVGMPLADRAALYESLGMTTEIALEVSQATNEDMGRSILALYRSAAQPFMAQLGARLGEASARPGLILYATDDPYTGGEAGARWAANEAKAQIAVLEGLGHWWMMQDPAAGAAAITRFWSSLEPS